MAISTETIILRVEGQTDGAVKATEKVTAAQKKLEKATQDAQAAMSGLAKTMIGLPPPPPAPLSTVGKLKEGLTAAGFSAKEFAGGLKEVGKGITFDYVRRGLKSLNESMDSLVKSTVNFGVQGAAIGSMFGGVWGAAAGFVGGALGNAVYRFLDGGEHAKRMERYAEIVKESTAVSDIYKEITRDINEWKDAEWQLYAAQSKRSSEAIDNARHEFGNAKLAADETVRQLRVAYITAKREREAADQLSGKSFGVSDQELQLARKLRDALLEQENAASLYGKTVLSIRLADNHRLDEQINLNKAYADGKITLDQYNKALRTLNAESIAAAKAAELNAAKESLRGRVLGGYEYGSTSAIVGGLGFAGSRNQIADEYSGNVTTGMINNATWNAELASYRAGGKESQSKLEKVFGPIEEFDAYKTAFETLQGATQSAFGAWIDGSMSAGEAWKKFMGESLKGTATFLLGESIKYGLMALSSAIPGPLFNPTSASAYAATAAKYAAGAAAVGVLAKGLGGGGGGSSSSGGGGAGGAAPTGSSAAPGTGGGGNTYVVSIGDSFADDSPNNRARKAERLIRTVMGSPGSKSE